MEKIPSLDEILKQEAEQEKALEATRKRKQEAYAQVAKAKFEEAKALIGDFKGHWDQSSISQLVGMLGVKAKGRSPAKDKGDKKTVAPKFAILFEGEQHTWAGRGVSPPKDFLKWDETEEGKTWHANNPKQRYPFHPEYVPTEKDKNWISEKSEKSKKKA